MTLSPEDAYKHVSAQQKLAAGPDASIWVSANAGSGKTKVLIDRVARLLLTGVTPDSILCITYTKAAASEMQQRLFKRLGSWSVMADADLAKDLKDLQGDEATGLESDQLKSARALFAKALETPGGLRIETLHAFAGRVLRRFPLEAGVPPGFSELDEVDSKRLWLKASRTAFYDGLEDPIRRGDFARLMEEVKGLRYEGAIDLVTFNAPKLRRFVNRYPTREDQYTMLGDMLNAPDMTRHQMLDHLVGSGLPKERLRAAIPILETGKAAKDRDLLETIARLVLEDDLEAGFEAYKSVFLTKAGELRKQAPFSKAHEGTLVEDLFALGGGRETVRFLDGMKLLAAITLRDRTLALLNMATPMLAAHTNEKRLRAGLDFDDLISETRKLLQNPGLAEWVLYKLDGGISHVLLDEAQDTSPDQWIIVNAIVEAFFAGDSGQKLIRTLFVVGDEKQSIYSFQGADTAKFQRERQTFASREQDEAAGVKFHLPAVEMSFRSTPQVLNFVDAVFNGPASQSGAPFSTEPPSGADTIRHHAFRHDQAGQVEFWPVVQPDTKATGVTWQAPLDMERQVSAQAALADRLANWIAWRLSDDAPPVWEDSNPATTRKARAGDILILVRSRKALFHSIIRALKTRNLPVAGADRVNLKEALPVQDVLNLIRYALCPEDDLTLAELLKGPFIGLTDDDAHLFPIAWDRGTKSLRARLFASYNPDFDFAKDFLTRLSTHRTLPAFEFLSWALNTRHKGRNQTGWQMIHARFGSPAKDPLDALLAISDGMDDAESASLQTFLTAMEGQDSEIKREPTGPANEIRVMTVHGAKGLEAPIVILPDTTGVSPSRLSGNLVFDESETPVWLLKGEDDCPATSVLRALEEEKARAESNRLLYVALTRAKDHLLICGAWKGHQNGKGYDENSWYDLCAQTTDLITDHETLTDDNGLWRMGALPALATAPASAPAASLPSPLPDWITKPVRRTSADRHDELRAPSQLLPGDTPVLPPFGKDHVKRFQRGRLIHALLEILPDTPPPEREARAVRFLSRCLDETESALADDILTVTFDVLNAPDLAEVFGPGGRAEAPVVGRGPNLPKGVIINGRLDRLRVTEDKVLVIDYKTDRPPPKRPEDVALPYLAQMGAYFDVLSMTYPNKSVQCALLWTDGPHFMVLNESDMMNALTKARGKV